MLKSRKNFKKPLDGNNFAVYNIIDSNDVADILLPHTRSYTTKIYIKENHYEVHT